MFPQTVKAAVETNIMMSKKISTMQHIIQIYAMWQGSMIEDEVIQKKTCFSQHIPQNAKD